MSEPWSGIRGTPTPVSSGSSVPPGQESPTRQIRSRSEPSQRSPSRPAAPWTRQRPTLQPTLSARHAPVHSIHSPGCHDPGRARPSGRCRDWRRAWRRLTDSVATMRGGRLTAPGCFARAGKVVAAAMAGTVAVYQVLNVRGGSREMTTASREWDVPGRAWSTAAGTSAARRGGRRGGPVRGSP